MDQCHRAVKPFFALFVGSVAAFCVLSANGGSTPPRHAPPVVSLDSAADWRVAFDPANVGRDETWWLKARPEAKPVRVPGTYQEVLPGCHGVAWYWREAVFPAAALADLPTDFDAQLRRMGMRDSDK